MDSIKSRKGSYIMEAAIVLPVIIFAVITVVLIIMFFYSNVTEQSMLHMALRKEAGLSVEKSLPVNDVECEAEYHIERKAAGAEAFGKKYIVMPYKGILAKKGAKAIEGSIFSPNAPRYVRYCNLVKDRGSDIDDEEQ